MDIEIEICDDCVMWHANRDLSGLDNYNESYATRRYREVSTATNEHVIIGDDQTTYSTTPCELCKDHCNGRRTSATIVEQTEGV